MLNVSVKSALNPLHTSLFLVVLGICVSLHIWKLAPALPFLQIELQLDLVEAGFLLASVQIAGMSLGLLIGLFAERIGLRRCILIGLSILSLASVLATFFNAKLIMMLCRALEGVGFLMVVLPGPALIKRMVPTDKLSRIMGWWGCYMPIGAVIILIVGAWFLSAYSWQALWLILAAITAVLWLLALKLLPADPDKSAASVAPALAALSMVRTTLSAGRVWIVAVCFGMYAAQWSALIGFLPTIYADAHIAGPVAGLLTALVAGANIIGNLSAGRLLHKGVPAAILLTVGLSTMIVCAVVAFALGAPVSVQFMAVFMFSAIGGLTPATLFMLAVTLAPTAQTTASTVGWVQQCSSLGQFAGPPVVGWVVYVLGGWQWAWVATSAFALVGIGLVFTLRYTAPPALAQN